MSSPAKALFLLSALLLAGCGFQPMYGKKWANDTPLGLAGVAVDPIGNGRMGQQFRADLEDKLNPDGKVPANPAYRLAATIGSTASAIGVARDGTISRYNVYLDSTYTLYSRSDNKPVTSGSLRHVSSYNNLTNAYFSTYVSEEDAIKRGVTELSEQFRQRLSPYLNGQRPPQKEPARAAPPPILMHPDGRIFQPNTINP